MSTHCAKVALYTVICKTDENVFVYDTKIYNNLVILKI